MQPAVAAVIIVAAVVAAAAIILIVTRRSHLRSWRLGVFYESEDRYGDESAAPTHHEPDREHGQHHGDG